MFATRFAERRRGGGEIARRGAGKRGGRGNAGIGKHKVMFRNKYMPGHWGMHGFNRHPGLRKVNVSINVSEVDQMTEGDSINLTEMGYDKLLGKGPITRAINITVSEASAGAVKKVEEAGGTVSTDGEDEFGEWEEE